MICQILAKCCVQNQEDGKRECSVFLDTALAIMFLTLGILACDNSISMSVSASYALLGVGIIYSLNMLFEIATAIKDKSSLKNKFVC